MMHWIKRLKLRNQAMLAAVSLIALALGIIWLL
jgi:hypothetical protein